MGVRGLAWAGAAVATVVLLAGCGSSSSGTGGRPGTLSIVATTSVYGDIAATIGGKRVSVQSIIDDPSQDPHSYEPSARTQLALSRADVVIENGGGYDDFADRMLASVDHRPTVLNAVRISGHTAPPGGDLNEHVWYDATSMRRLVARLVSRPRRGRPRRQGGVPLPRGRLRPRARGPDPDRDGDQGAHAGEGVAITEPVPLYLLQACGLVNRTPPAFSEAVEAGQDVSVRVLNETTSLFAQHRVMLLAYNEQTSGAETQRVLAAAHAADVPVLGVTETLPTGEHYLGWMRGYLHRIKADLG